MTADKVRENRLRRMAQRQGLTLHRNRRRDPRARDFGTYQLVNEHGVSVAGPWMSIDNVERYLTGAPDPDPQDVARELRGIFRTDEQEQP